MKAVVFHAPGDVRVEDVPNAECPPLGALVKVEACAVCGSDMKAAAVGNVRIKPPRVMGHEFSGIVIEKDPAAEGGFKVGDRVVMATSVSCGTCYYCRRGYLNLCSDLAPMGFSYHGGMAGFVAIPARAVENGHVIVAPPSLSAEVAALAEPVSCAVNAVGQCGVKSGDVVLVIGGGPMGILNACVARASGASKIILSETSENRLRQYEQFKFTRLVNPVKENLKDLILAETGGIGADVVIVTAPAAAPQEQALDLVRKQGAVMLFASLPVGKSTLQVDSRLIHYKELRVLGSSDSTPDHVRKALQFLGSGEFPADKIITHRLPLDGIHQAFQLMHAGEALRVVLKP